MTDQSEQVTYNSAADTRAHSHLVMQLLNANLVDLAEMLCDWVAASERNPNGDPLKSIEIGQEKHGFSDDLRAILENTVRDLGRVE